MKPRSLFLILIVLLSFLNSCEKEDGYKSYSEIFLTQINHSANSTFYEYDANGQVIKVTSSEQKTYSEYEYDDQGRIVKQSIYYGSYYPELENELTYFDTFVYENNKIVQTLYDDIIYDGVLENIAYKEYFLNSNNECINLVEHNSDGSVYLSTVITWSKGNLQEYTMTYENGSWRNAIYEHDSEYNPMRLCSSTFDPWRLSKNNLTRATIHKSYAEEIDIIEWSYEYNAYGFPIKKERIGVDGHPDEYIYDIN